jgi:Zn-dependent protease
MGWQDRPYYRDGGQAARNPLSWLMTGSVPMFTAFGIRVRAHASLIICMVLVLIFGVGGFGNTFLGRLEALSALFLIVLLHEFGHCFTARWVGGSADDILMTPLGGLAMAHAPRRPLPTFLTVAGGPAVNVLICLVSGAYLVAFGFWLPINLFHWYTYVGGGHAIITSTIPSDALNFFVLLVFSTSWMLLLFNVLPIYPLDGGQMLQAILWPHVGYHRSLKLAAITGMIGAGVVAVYGIFEGSLMLVLIMFFCFLNCWNLNQQLKYAGAEEFDNPDAVDYSASIYAKDPKPRKPRKNWFARRTASLEEERAEQEKIDGILAKVSAQGMNSLTWMEKRALRQATERQRRRDVEHNRRMRM